jgi:hypothetical protein
MITLEFGQRDGSHLQPDRVDCSCLEDLPALVQEAGRVATDEDCARGVRSCYISGH